MDIKSLRGLKNKVEAELLSKPFVKGVGIGLTVPNDEQSGPVIIVYTDSTADPAGFAEFEKGIATFEVDGQIVPIRIESTGPFYANAYGPEPIISEPIEVASGHPVYSSRKRPLQPGYSVGVIRRTMSGYEYYGSGTFGLFVRKVKTGKLLLLSNQHVLNPLNAKIDYRVLQPGTADYFNVGTDQVGNTYNPLPYLADAGNWGDAALGELDAGVTYDPQYPEVGIVGGHHANIAVGWGLMKVGRTTGYVTGNVDSVDVTVKVQYHDGKVREFIKQVIVKNPQKPVSLPGDSGSVWLRSGDNYACALNFAGPSDGMYSVSTPIHFAMLIFSVQTTGYRLSMGKTIDSYPSSAILNTEDSSFIKGILSTVTTG